MALQLWLPLNGNLKNQGLSNVTITEVGGSASYASGKTGQGLSCNGSKYWEITGVTLDTKASVCCWSKTSTGSRMVWVLDCVSGGCLNLYASTIYTLNMGDSNNNPFRDDSGNNISVLNNGTWHHFVVTFDGTDAKLYIDGEYRGKALTYRSPQFNASHKTIKLAGGYNNKHSYDWNGMINDFRVYDHCLSPKEIKEISRALVLHYKLDDSNRTLAISNETETNIPKGNASTQTSYVNTSADEIYVVEADVKSSAALNGNQCLLWQYYNSSGTRTRYEWVEADTTTTYKHVSSRITVGSDIAKLSVGYRAPNSGGVSNTIKNLYIYKVDSSTYDCSGYGNDGTVGGTLKLSDDTPRYAASTIFDGNSACINAGRGAMVKDAISVCCWGYMSNWGSFNARLLSCTEGGGWNFEPASGKMNFVCGTGASSNTYIRATSSIALSSLTPGWHHFVGTYDGFNVKIYTDGVLDGSLVAYTTKTPIFYNGTNVIFVGAESSSGNTTPAGSYFNGKFSDVRIYATALSEADVKELYDTSALLTNNGTLYGYELVESEDNGISKNGIIKSGSFIESDLTTEKMKIFDDEIQANIFNEI